jgi:site-specific DNA-cytosine methylase
MSLGMKRAGIRCAGAYDLWSKALAVHEANLKPFLFNLNGVKRAHRRNLGGFDIEGLKILHEEACEEVAELETAPKKKAKHNKHLDKLATFIQESEAVGDILSLIPEIIELAPDVIAGGPPCPPWSNAGARLSDKDPRAKLTDAYGLIVCAVRPKYFLLENVPGIVHSDIFKRIKSTLKRGGYGLTETVLDASYYGVAQRRKRLFLIGCLGESDGWLLDHLHAAKSPKQLTAADVLGDEFGKLHYLCHTPDGRKIWRAADDNRSLKLGSFTESARFFWLSQVYPDSSVGSCRADEPIMTIAGKMLSQPTPRYPIKPERDVEDIFDLPIPTFQQLARLGGFPESWDWSPLDSNAVDRLKILSNAVPPPVAEAIGRCILAHHKGERAPTAIKIPKGFKGWLKEHKGLKEPRLSQVLSEFRAVQQYAGSRTFDDLRAGLDFMDRIPEFQTLGAARKSNLRKALRLWAECVEFHKPKPPQPDFRKNKLSRRLTRSGDALTI